MAGIIGQLTANARRRKGVRRIHSDKCMYSIPEFDRNGFNPQVHNSFVRNRRRMEAENMDSEEEEDKIVQEERKVRKNNDWKALNYIIQVPEIVPPLTLMNLLPEVILYLFIIFILPTWFIIYFCIKNFHFISLMFAK